jgi:hypothetical protein
MSFKLTIPEAGQASLIVEEQGIIVIIRRQSFSGLAKCIRILRTKQI